MVLDPNHGTVYLKNGATLSNAKNAITTQREGYFLSYNGGRIFADNANFINNRRSAEILYYQVPVNPGNNQYAPNNSYFKSCTFECNAPMNDLDYTDQWGRRLGSSVFVTLWGTKGVRFEGNTFKNTGNFDPDLRTWAIHSMDATYYVEERCTSITSAGCTGGIPNTFIGLTRGIDFNSAAGGYAAFIRNNLFDDVSQGITLQGGGYSEVENNTFTNIPGTRFNPNIITPYEIASWGVVVLGNTGSIVQENTFTSSFSGTFSNWWPRGVWCSDTWGSGLEVYDNSFNGKIIGTQSEDDNQAATVKCNAFNDGFAIAVTSGNFPDQGYCFLNNDQTPAGNDFNNIVSIHPEQHIYNGSPNPFIYSHHQPTGAFPNVKPVLFSAGSVVLQPCSPDKTVISCIELAGGGSGNNQNQLIYTTQQLTNAKSAIDGGNSAYLLQAIGPGSGMSHGDLKNLLQNAYPLSEMVLLALVNRTPSLPAGILQQILIANSPLPDTVLVALSGIVLPGGVSNQIGNAQANWPSIMDELQWEISYWERERQYAVNAIVRDYLYSQKEDLAHQFLDSVGIYPAKCGAVGVAQAMADTINAQIGIDSLPHPGLAELYYCKLQKIILTAVKAGGDYTVLDSGAVAILKQIASSPYPSSWPAKTILEFSFGDSSYYVPEPIQFQAQTMLRSIDNEAEMGKGHSRLIACFPNPTKGKVQFDLYLEDGDAPCKIEIFNVVTGQLVFDDLTSNIGKITVHADVSNLSNGIYVFKVTARSKVLATGKIVRIE